MHTTTKMEQQPTFHQPVAYIQLPFNVELAPSSTQQLQPQMMTLPNFKLVCKTPKATDKKAQSIKKTRPRGRNLIVPSSKLMFEHVHALIDGRYFCTICDSTYKTIATILAHIRQIHLKDESFCQEPGCNHHALTRSERARHQKKHDNEKDQERIARRVEEFNKASEEKKPKFPSEEKMKELFLQNNKDIAGMFKSLDVQKRKIVYTCETCSQNFHHSFHAAKHVEIHIKSPQVCYYCGDVRNGNIDVQTHYIKKHQNDAIRVYTCNNCDKRFTSIQCYSQHLKYMNLAGCCPEQMVQEVYYGELPESVIVDNITRQRIDLYRRQNCDRKKNNGDPSNEIIFSKTLVQAENGLKYFIDHQTPVVQSERTATYCSPVYFASQGAYWYNPPIIAQSPNATFYTPAPLPPPQNSQLFVGPDPLPNGGGSSGKPFGCPMYIVPQPYLTHTTTVSPMVPQHETHSSPITLNASQHQEARSHQQENNSFPSLNDYGLPHDVSDFGMDLLNDDPDFTKVFNNI